MNANQSLAELEFQSTLPRGSDISSISSWLIASYFNPRSLAGATFFCTIFFDCNSYFNPRSLAGATDNDGNIGIKFRFQSTLPRGSDLRFISSNAAFRISIHAPSRERPTSFLKLLARTLFQSTLPRGSDLASAASSRSRS